MGSMVEGVGLQNAVVEILGNAVFYRERLAELCQGFYNPLGNLATGG